MSSSEISGAPNDTPRIPNIEIIGLLGRGGMAAVYRAKMMEREVAVKVLQEGALDQTELRRFQREAKSTAALKDHPNIIKVLQFGIADSKAYITMELLAGGSLADRLSKSRLSLEEIGAYFPPLLSALDCAHSEGIIHRDLKPANIMFQTEADGQLTPKLVDFGIARNISPNSPNTQLTMDGSLLGSPAYMSPEQCAGSQLDGRSDIYSMACVVYEAMTGTVPFKGENVLEVMYQHSNAPRPIAKQVCSEFGLSLPVVNCVIRAMSIDREQRYPSAPEFSAALSAALIPENKRSKHIAMAAITIGGVLVAVLGFMVVQKSNNPRAIIFPQQPSMTKPKIGRPTPEVEPAKRYGALLTRIDEQITKLASLTNKDTPDATAIFVSGMEFVAEAEKCAVSHPDQVDLLSVYYKLRMLTQEKGGTRLTEGVFKKLREKNAKYPIRIHHINRVVLRVKCESHTATNDDVETVLRFDREASRKQELPGLVYCWDITMALNHYSSVKNDSEVRKYLEELRTAMKIPLTSSQRSQLTHSVISSIANSSRYERMGIDFGNEQLKRYPNDFSKACEVRWGMSLCYRHLNDQDHEVGELEQVVKAGHPNNDSFVDAQKRLKELGIKLK